jgi:hypothetical protein
MMSSFETLANTGAAVVSRARAKTGWVFGTISATGSSVPHNKFVN